ncbi:MAG: hypothetical protein IPJ48_06605 [Propionivibrio sp.]|uniref:Uncharacterized protein n=1 Tax=Candidatus Propionivibrio dominans TaxID=2954373 RepID=A0A9D7F697_9RHOO|nr:hypothetical protein [Candidatus Propionivibrio dominans]
MRRKNHGFRPTPPDQTPGTAAFAVGSIRRWWLSMGKEKYPSVLTPS